MRHKFFASSFFTAVLLLAAALVFGRLETSAAAEDSQQVSQLLEDIKTQAADLQRDSEELESFTHSNMSWESHADELSRIRDRINTIGHTIEKLKKMRNNASPWQQEAIDRIIPVAEQVASNTTAAIQDLNKDPLHLQDIQYQEYLKSNSEAASQLAGMVRDFVDYGKAKKTLDILERRLEISKGYRHRHDVQADAADGSMSGKSKGPVESHCFCDRTGLKRRGSGIYSTVG
jgi:septal ring factor EnvC (AmiA/AmiB activator)